MSNLLKHAKKELELSGVDEDIYGDMTSKAVLELVEVFAKQGHSGMSAGYVRSLFNKVANYEPLTPLTGEDEEWEDVSEYGDKGTFQNKRCSNVFKGADGLAYNVSGVVFEDENGCTYTSKDSRVNVTFPYMPVTEFRKDNA